VVFAYNSKHIALVNAQVLATGTPTVDDSKLVDFETDLPLSATSAVTFSGGSAFIAGGIPDVGRKGVWLVTADGYAFFDVTKEKLGTVFPVDTPTEFWPENLGGDTSHNILFGANYLGIQLIDLVAGKSFDMDPTAFANAFKDTSGTPIQGLFVGPDAGSVDSALQVGILTFEDRSDVGFINLGTIAKTTATSGPSSFVAAPGGTSMVRLSSTGFGPPTISGSAVDSSTDLTLFMAGFSDDMAVGHLQDPSSVPASGTWAGLTDWSFFTLSNSPSLSSYTSARDPHAVGVVFNTQANKPFGYLLDGCNCRAIQVDMSAFLALPRAGTSGDAAHQAAGDPAALGALKPIAF
jgi:hypothetical protein